jgi:hypothetical protein
MTRLRWYKTSAPSGLDILARQLSQRLFSLKEPISLGFRIERKAKHSFAGQFIHKRTIDQVITLPSGDEFSQEVASIDVVNFGVCMSEAGGWLYLKNAPRSLTPFFSAFSEATNFSCTIEPLHIDIDLWIKEIEPHAPNLLTSYLDITGIAVSDGVSARIAISGNRDIHAAITEFLGRDKKGVIESAKIVLNHEGTPYIIELGRKASLKLPVDFPETGIEILQSTMFASQSKQEQ